MITREARKMITAPETWIELRNENLTDEAFAKLNAWEFRPLPTTELFCRGGDHISTVVLQRVVDSLPEPVRKYISSRAVFFPFGLGLTGICGPHQERDASRPWEIWIFGCTLEEFQYVAAHEIAHAWCRQEPEPGVTAWNITAADHAWALRELAGDDPDQQRTAIEALGESLYQEAIADNLAAAWGYPRPEKKP